MADRQVQRNEAVQAVHASEGRGVFAPVSRNWWFHWKRWVEGYEEKTPGPIRQVENDGNVVDEVYWIPQQLFEALAKLNGNAQQDTSHIRQSKGMRLTNSRWDFSWDYASPQSCWCCGDGLATTRCGRCHVARYCGARCQQIHWVSIHSASCGQFAGEPEDVVQLAMSQARKQPKGLANLGNSCFMNATVQCLVAVRPLFKYFLRNEWTEDLQTKHRNVAVAFADLCKSLAFSEIDFVNPSQLKKAVSKLSTGLFAGYQQNDAEELLLFLLDTLHEDLDVVREKGPPPREDEDQWYSHRRREHSIIDSLTLGSYETNTKCSKCGHDSAKTDVFKHLNLALPPNSPNRVIVVVVVRQPMHANLKGLPQRACQTRYAVLVGKDGTCEAFQREVASASRVPFERLWFVSVERGTLTREIQPQLALKKVPAPSLSGDIMVVAYEIGVTPRARSSAQDRIEDTKRSEDVEMKADDEDDRHIICMFARGTRIERVIPVCISFSASNDSVGSMLVKLREAVSRSTKDADVKFSLGDASGHFDESRDLSAVDATTRFVDVFENPNFKSGHIRIEFIVCMRSPNAAPLKNEFQDHDSCTRLKSQLANELKGESVLSCLQHFVQPNVLDENNCWKCPKCSVVAPATQRIQFTRLPDVLILVLKRFDIMEGKITSLVRFDVEGMDLSDFLSGSNFREQSQVYDLFAVVNHYGSMVGGHYTAFVARDSTDYGPATKWDEVDDSKRMDISKEQVISPAAYILFYRKRRVGQ